jgi:hypothetical protein
MRDDPDHKGESGKAEEFSESCRKVGKWTSWGEEEAKQQTLILCVSVVVTVTRIVPINQGAKKNSMIGRSYQAWHGKVIPPYLFPCVDSV